MATIVPFRAVRPTKDKVSLVTSRSYEEYSAAELAAQLDFNPLSFLHVLNPAYTKLHQTESEQRFRLVKQKYREFCGDNILVRDEKPSVYLHKIVSDSNTFTGIIAGTSVADYNNQIIKTHEDTISYRVEFFKEYMHHSGFNTEPVLIAYPSNGNVAAWMHRHMQSEPDYQFATTRREIHYFWKIDDADEIGDLQRMFAAMEKIYIADGHHRSASAVLLCDEHCNETDDSRKYFMSFLIPDDNVRIYSFNRLIKDLNGLSKSAFLEELSNHFHLKPTSRQVFIPGKRHEFGMYIDGEFYSLTLKEENQRFDSALESLDTQLLYNYVLSPILNIHDLRTDDRIAYMSGKQHVSAFMSRIDEGDYRLGFLLFPSEFAEIREIADAHLTMPPKSTFIEPKLRSGLVIYELENED